MLFDKYAVKVWIQRPRKDSSYEPMLFSMSTYEDPLQVEMVVSLLDDINTKFGGEVAKYEVYLINKPERLTPFEDYMITQDVADCMITLQYKGVTGKEELKEVTYNHFINGFNATVLIVDRKHCYELLTKWGIKNVKLLTDNDNVKREDASN